jgi:hypothetical protein
MLASACLQLHAMARRADALNPNLCAQAYLGFCLCSHSLRAGGECNGLDTPQTQGDCPCSAAGYAGRFPHAAQARPYARSRAVTPATPPRGREPRAQVSNPVTGLGTDRAKRRIKRKRPYSPPARDVPQMARRSPKVARNSAERSVASGYSGEFAGKASPAVESGMDVRDEAAYQPAMHLLRGMVTAPMGQASHQPAPQDSSAAGGTCTMAPPGLPIVDCLDFLVNEFLPPLYEAAQVPDLGSGE